MAGGSLPLWLAAPFATWVSGVNQLDCSPGTSLEACLNITGCRWFSLEGSCPSCKSWFGDQSSVTGCHTWDPEEFCTSRIMLPAAMAFDIDPHGESFRRSVAHYKVQQGNPDISNPFHLKASCAVWCDQSDPSSCSGLVRPESSIRGVNYGGRFVPEQYLNLDGYDELFNGVSGPNPSLCDIGELPDAKERFEKFLERIIKRSHFAMMKKKGFNTVRLPLGYWNLVDLGVAVPEGRYPEKWRSMQDVINSTSSRRWINKVMGYAAEANLTVLLDLHAAPGAQEHNNPFTGCAVEEVNFQTARNFQIATEAVVEMAKICAAWQATCFGVELLNEPCCYSGSRQLDRRDLAKWYRDAIQAARQHMLMDKPIVLMDWNTHIESFWLSTFWQDFSYEQAGRILWDLHIYHTELLPEMTGARAAYTNDLNQLMSFQWDFGLSTFVGEWAVLNHGNATMSDPFDYTSFTDWAVHQFELRSFGQVVWNFDASFKAWGPVSSTCGHAPIPWAQIWDNSLDIVMEASGGSKTAQLDDGLVVI